MPASSRFSSSPNPEVARLWRGRWSGVPYRYRSELVFWRAACYRQLFGAALPLQRSSGDSALATWRASAVSAALKTVSPRNSPQPRIEKTNGLRRHAALPHRGPKPPRALTRLEYEPESHSQTAPKLECTITAPSLNLWLPSRQQLLHSPFLLLRQPSQHPFRLLPLAPFRPPPSAQHCSRHSPLALACSTSRLCPPRRHECRARREAPPHSYP